MKLLGKASIKKTKKTMEFSKAGLTPASQATFGRSYGKKQKKIKTLKNDLRVMKQILYDMGKKKIFFFNYIFPIFD